MKTSIINWNIVVRTAIYLLAFIRTNCTTTSKLHKCQCNVIAVVRDRTVFSPPSDPQT